MRRARCYDEIDQLGNSGREVELSPVQIELREDAKTDRELDAEEREGLKRYNLA